MKPFDWARPSRAGAALAAGTAGTLLLFMAAGPVSSAARPRPNAKVAVPQGIGAAALSGDPVFGTTPAGTKETVSFILKARHIAALKADVAHGMPSGPLSVSGFARAFGQTPQHISALRRYLAHFKIHAKAYRDRLDVTATGTAGEFDRALTVQQENFRIPAVKGRNGQPGRPAMIIHGTKDTPLLPRGIAQFVLAVLGLTNYPIASSNAVHEPLIAKGARPATVQTGSRTPADFARQYNLGPLYRAGFTGAGRTIGIVTLASMQAADATFFWKHVLHIRTRAHRIKLINVDGGAGKVSDAAGSGETTLDVEQSGALAPGAKVVVYQAPNTDPGFLDAFYDAASQDAADTVSTSWGEAETVIDTFVATGQEDPAYEVAFDEAFLEMGAQGQSTFVTAGDSGAYDDSGELGSTNLAVDNPGDSPWATTAGGTTLAGTIPLTKTDSAHIPAQRAWGWDWLWPHFTSFSGFRSEAQFAFAEPAGGGGGFSADVPMPGYQRLTPGIHQFSDAEYLTPTDPKQFGTVMLPTAWTFNAHPSVKTGTGFGRAVPDVSTDADPFTGYEEYFTGFTGDPLESGWGGTSFVAPQLNGSTAVIDQAAGRRVGLWNPSIYRWAALANSPFHPLSTPTASNTNLFYTGTPGHIFDPASGLGTPNLAELARDFAHSAAEEARLIRGKRR